MSSLDVALDGDNWTLDAEGGLLDTTTVSVMLTDVVVQASPLVPPPLAVIPAMPAVTVPLPEEGAVQSKLHARFALLVMYRLDRISESQSRNAEPHHDRV